MNKKITITISGPGKSGKSILAEFIAEQLKSHKLDVQIEETDSRQSNAGLIGIVKSEVSIITQTTR